MKLFVQAAAEADILHEVERFTELELPDVARRFSASVLEAFDSIAAMPSAGSPRRSANKKLSGLRAWSVKGFDDFRVYYLFRADRVIVIRVLHGKRDLSRLLSRSRS